MVCGRTGVTTLWEGACEFDGTRWGCEQIAWGQGPARDLRTDQQEAAMARAAVPDQPAEPAVAAARPARHEPLRHLGEDQDRGDRGAAEGGADRAPAGWQVER